MDYFWKPIKQKKIEKLNLFRRKRVSRSIDYPPKSLLNISEVRRMKENQIVKDCEKVNSKFEQVMSKVGRKWKPIVNIMTKERFFHQN